MQTYCNYCKDHDTIDTLHNPHEYFIIADELVYVVCKNVSI